MEIDLLEFRLLKPILSQYSSGTVTAARVQQYEKTCQYLENNGYFKIKVIFLCLSNIGNF